MTPSEQLDQILTKGWLGDIRLKHEVFRLVAKAFGAAAEDVRARFIDRALAAMTPPPASADTEEQRTDAYERYNLLVWLERAAPESVITKQQLAAAQAAHPAFAKRDHPDLTHWSSGAQWVQSIAPATSEDLLAKPPGEQLPWLLTFEGSGDPFEGPDREGLLNAVGEASKNSFPWGWELASLLVKHEGDDRGLWNAILGAWTKSSLTAEQWTQLLAFLNHVQLIEKAAPRAVADLLEHAVEQEGTISPNLVGIVIEMVERLVARTDVEDGVVPRPPIDWLLLALNHTAGRAMITWLRALGKRRTAAGESWVGLGQEERSRLEFVIQSAGQSADRARTIIASQAHFLFALDSDWWRKAVLPLFDWSADALRASQAWSGYLQWGRWNSALFTAMRPFYEQTFSKIDTALPDLIDRFGGWLANIAIYSPDDPWHDGWLRPFVLSSAPATRAAWARHVGFDLRDLEPAATERAWRTWINDFWKDRLTGIPRALSEEERAAMIEWVPRLGAVASEAVSLFERMSFSLPEHTSVFFELEQDGIARQHPEPMARFLRHLLKNTTQLHWECEHVDRVVRILIAARIVDGIILLAILEEMARLGCPSASELQGLLGRAGH